MLGNLMAPQWKLIAEAVGWFNIIIECTVSGVQLRFRRSTGLLFFAKPLRFGLQ